jgi:MFS family permease
MRLAKGQGARAALLGVVLVAAALAWPDVHQGFSLHYDEAVHLVIAHALARGHGYIDESLPGSPPHRKYPPLLSLILAPFWRLSDEFPGNLAAMRLMMLAAALLSLGVSYRYLIEGERASPALALATVAAVGWNVLFLTFATLLSSEMIYFLLSMTSLLAYARFETGGRRPWLAAAVAAAAFAAATRTLGLALLGALVLHLALRRRLWAAVAALGAALTVTVPWQVWGWAAQRPYRTYPPEVANNYVGYLEQLVLHQWYERLPTMLATNIRSLADSWGFVVLPWAPIVLRGTTWSILAGLLVVLSVGWRLIRIHRKGLALADLYAAGYLTFVVLWPWPFSERFLWVVAPLLVFAAFDAFTAPIERRHAASRARRLAARVGPAILVAAILMTTLGQLWLRWSVSERYEALRENFQQMMTWIERQTPPDAVLVGTFDPLYYLMTGRRAVRLAYPDPFAIYYTREPRNEFPAAARLLAWYRQIGACWVVQEPMITEPGQITYYYRLIQALRAASGNTLQEVYRAGDGWFAIYRLQGCPA